MHPPGERELRACPGIDGAGLVPWSERQAHRVNCRAVILGRLPPALRSPYQSGAPEDDLVDIHGWVGVSRPPFDFP